MSDLKETLSKADPQIQIDALIKENERLKAAIIKQHDEMNAELEQYFEIRQDREHFIGLLADLVSINPEPHQSYEDRLYEAIKELTSTKQDNHD